MVDLDMNTLTCKSLPAGVTPRAKSEKIRQKLYIAMGCEYRE